MYYSEEVINEVAQKNDILDVIGSYVHLTRKGANYFGLCPFHNEKSGSFSVRQDRQSYHCFGCGAKGNVFRFIMNHENYTFPEAVEFLAERAGVKLPENTGGGDPAASKARKDKKEALLAINKEAATLYFRILRDEMGAEGLKYFQGRQLTQETMRQFGLGYAPVHNSVLVKHLKSLGYSEKLIQEAGLASFHEKYGMSDKFYNRVMFPIQDMNHKVIGFGGRVLGDAKPKYLNSPETEIFDKSKNLYGLNFARTCKKNHFILCEGYMDVIALHQAGFTESVASLGTAFTSGQAMILKRYTKNVYLSYDSDEAGVKAALRAIQILREAGLNGKVIDMRPYKDPDEFIKNLGAEAYQKRIDEAENGFFFEVRQAEGKYNLSSPDEKTDFHKEIASLLYRFDDETGRDNYLQAVAEKYQIKPENIRKDLGKLAAKGVNERPRLLQSEIKSGLNKEEKEDGGKKSQRLLLNWLTDHPNLYGNIRDYVSVEDFSEGLYREVATKVFQSLEAGSFNPSTVINSFADPEKQDLVAEIFATILPELETTEEKEREIRDVIISVKTHSLQMMQEAGCDFSKRVEAKKNLEKLKRIKISIG